MSQDSGTFPAGGYYYLPNTQRWSFLLPYTSIMNNLFGVAEAILCLPLPDQELLPVGDLGDAHINLYRNGVTLTSGFYAVPGGLALTQPARVNDYYVVGLSSPLTARTPISGGGAGIPDAPNDGGRYARAYGQWIDSEDMEFNEGPF